MRTTAKLETARAERVARRSVRGRLVNYVTALTVNAAIVLSAPRPNHVNPAPMVLRVKQRLIHGRWHEGEYVAGERPSVVIMPLQDAKTSSYGESVISKN